MPCCDVGSLRICDIPLEFLAISSSQGDFAKCDSEVQFRGNETEPDPVGIFLKLKLLMP